MLSLWGMPALESYPHRVPARVFNLWRRYRLRHGETLRLELVHTPPMALDMEAGQWVCVDVNLHDAPVIAWSAFQDRDQPLHEPIPCEVTHFHFGASAIRDRVLNELADWLEEALTPASAGLVGTGH